MSIGSGDISDFFRSEQIREIPRLRSEMTEEMASVPLDFLRLLRIKTLRKLWNIPFVIYYSHFSRLVWFY